MKIAIDLDGTAFEWPREFQALVTHLIMGAAEVVILTAAAGEFEPRLRPGEVARRIAARLPFLVDVPVHCCEASEKGEWLNYHQFDILVDDKPPSDWNGLRLVPVK